MNIDLFERLTILQAQLDELAWLLTQAVEGNVPNVPGFHGRAASALEWVRRPDRPRPGTQRL